ncbi:MAG: ABC transporter substrate-binding protein [Clostridia bacterium]|nr:ABC transporter substrate-binding protein [Clostridia bacterium]
MSKVKVVKVKEPKPPKQKRERKPVANYVIAAVAVVIVAVLVLIWALPHLPQKPLTSAKSGYKGIIELWNVETFEGGSGSRQSWLTNKSAKFEQVNSGLFVHITTMTQAELTQKINDGQNFDIVCFSRGTGDIVKEMLTPLTVACRDVCDNYLLSAQMDGKQYAVPLYAGGYCLFARTSQLAEADLLAKSLTQTYTRKVGKNTFDLQPLICGFTASNSPLTALAMNGGQGKVTNIDEDVTQYSAYEKFVDNKTAVTLLGTQRDMYRLSQREQNGKIDELGFYPLTAYTDLVQYLGVSVNSGEKTAACMQYIDYLLSAEVQQTLVNVSVFSVLDVSIYTDKRYSAMEQGLKQAFVPNVFVDAEIIANQRQTAKSTLAM